MVCYHRRFVKKDEVSFTPFAPQLIASPIVLNIPRKPSGRRLYDEVWSIASTLLRANCKFQRPSLRWWETKNWKQTVKDPNNTFKPFILKTVDKSGYACSRCHWTEKCSGCIVEPTDSPVFMDNLVENSFLAIEWCNTSLTDNYNQAAHEVVEHSTVFERQLGID